jgi:translation initiation factor IF-3
VARRGQGVGGDRLIEKEYRVNERIRVPEVRLVDEEGTQLGVMATREALRLARERELDLIEVSPNSSPPVCRIMDYGKYRYEQRKRDREGVKKTKQAEMRMITSSPRIHDHDFGVKLRLLRKFLSEGSKVRLTIRFRSRELSHPEIGARLLTRFADEASEQCVVERGPVTEGRMMTMIVAPKR